MTRGRAALVVATFAASLVWVLATPWCTRDRASAEEFVSAARTVMSDLPPGVIVLVHPPWRDDAVAAIRRAAIFPAQVAVTTALSPRHGEALPPLVLLVDDAAPPLPRALRSRLVRQRDVGPVHVAEIDERPDSATARDLSDVLASAEVEVERGGETVHCAWSAGAQRHECPGLPAWVHVGVEALPVGGRTERCTWAHPVTGATVVVRFAATRLLGALTLELALTDGAADNATLAPVHAALLVDGAPVLDLDKPPGRRGFVREATSTGTANDAQVELRITTPSDGQRHTCFRLITQAAP